MKSSQVRRARAQMSCDFILYGIGNSREER